jgi:hypothetical protein
MKVALLVDGFLSRGGGGSTDKLRPYFEIVGMRSIPWSSALSLWTNSK